VAIGGEGGTKLERREEEDNMWRRSKSNFLCLIVTSQNFPKHDVLSEGDTLV
jgi:hypothetical protein